jgi:hypothetical protein
MVKRLAIATLFRLSRAVLFGEQEQFVAGEFGMPNPFHDQHLLTRSV